MRVGLLLVWLSLAGLAQEPLRLVQWSDIHSGGEHYSAAALDEARRQGLAFRPHGLIISGDNGDNGESPATFSDRLAAFLQRLALSLRSVKVPLILCLGNNDFSDNYQSDPPLLAQTERLFQAAFGQRYYLDRLGNGVLPVRLGGQRWITLNSQIFSRKNRYAGAGEQARQTLDWLEQQLKGGPVVLVVHIPPTWDIYDGKCAWRVDCLRRFAAILRAYPGAVTIVAGHYHRNQVQGLRRAQGDIPILVAGSLSNKYGYEPNWRTYEWTLDAQRTPRRFDYTVYYPGHSDWTHRYRLEGLEAFNRLLEQPGFYPGFVMDLFPHEANVPARIVDPGLKAQYMREYWVEAPP